MRDRAWGLAALALGAGVAGCGADERSALQPARAESSRVALTVSYPGLAPWALITYRGAQGQHCQALGMFTSSGPRLPSAPGEPLESALASEGRCLEDGHGAVSLAIDDGGPVRVVGGIVGRGVRRIIVAGERVRPAASGAFLVTQPRSSQLGRSIELVYAGGGRERVPLQAALRSPEPS